MVTSCVPMFTSCSLMVTSCSLMVTLCLPTFTFVYFMVTSCLPTFTFVYLMFTNCYIMFTHGYLMFTRLPTFTLVYFMFTHGYLMFTHIYLCVCYICPFLHHINTHNLHSPHVYSSLLLVQPCSSIYSCNMGMSGLPDIYTQSTRAAGPRAEDVYIRQTMSTPCYNCYVPLVYRTETHVSTK